jgi:predicted sulfurtransferase
MAASYGNATNDEDDCCPWRIALYYCYVDVPDVPCHIRFQQETCNELSLNGRVRVASDGLNGVLSGKRERLKEYETRLREELTVGMASAENCRTRTDELELDVKYCLLRNDLPVQEQLFCSLQVQATKHVINLVDEPRRAPKRGKSKSVRPENSKVLKLWADVQADPTGTVCPHLSPSEWNERITNLGAHETAIIVDCRNSYESAIGYFDAPRVATLLTNTRKYSELPGVFLEQKKLLASYTHCFLMCTGGVRCEMASKFLHRLLDEDESSSDRPLPQIYQLSGGIQRYLEHQQKRQGSTMEPSTIKQANYFKGKNFVFDPRRTDPVHGIGIVGRCVVCTAPHDDYDNGHAPASGTGEARCTSCRVLLLVCPPCRLAVTCWGQEHPNSGCIGEEKPKLYCGGVGGPCLQKPPARLIVNAESVAS